MGQLKATFTLSRYSLLATLRSPTSVVFSLLFPIIFIVVFGSIVGDKPPSFKVAIAPGSDTANIVFRAVHNIAAITFDKSAATFAAQSSALKKGHINAILSIVADNSTTVPHYNLQLQAADTSGNISLLRMMLNEAIVGVNQRVYPQSPSVAALSVTKVPGRIYRTIDFILPGQLGFSLLMAGIFGSSFLLFSLRQNLVLKRLQATPVRRHSIIAGEMLSRLFFHLISFIIMIALGYFAFSFTLINGWATFLEMLVFSLLGLFVFMGIGFIISGLTRSESSIAPIANTVVLPQILLCGLFFPVSSYPHWLQSFCNILPLTLFVDGLRNIAFDNIHIWQMPLKIVGLCAWIVIIGFLAIKTFRWE